MVKQLYAASGIIAELRLMRCAYQAYEFGHGAELRLMRYAYQAYNPASALNCA